MREIAEKRLEEFEDLAMDGVKQIRAFFTYQGGNQAAYLQKAKLGATVISSYARMRASETNRLAVELAAGRALVPATPPKKLKP